MARLVAMEDMAERCPKSLDDLPRPIAITTAPSGGPSTPNPNYSYRKPYPDQAPPYRPPETPAKPQQTTKPTAQQHQTGLIDPKQHLQDIFKINTAAAKNTASSGMLLAPRPPTKKK